MSAHRQIVLFQFGMVTPGRILSSNGEWVGKREIALNPTSAVLTSLAWNGVIANWNMPDLETMNVYPFHFPDQSQMSWSPDNNQLATFVSTGEGDPVLIWRLASPDHEKPYHMLVGDVVSGLSWTYVTTLKWVSEHQLVTTSENVPINYIFRSVERWNTESGESEQVIFRSEGICGVYGWNSDFSKVACENYDPTTISVRELSTDSLLLTIPVSEYVSQIVWSPDDTTLAIISRNFATNASQLQLWNGETGIPLLTYDFSDRDASIVWSPDSKKAVLSFFNDNNFTIKVLDISTREYLLETNGGGFAWSPDSQIVAISDSNTINFWDINTGEIIETDPAPAYSTLAWSPDGTKLAVGASDGTIRIWDVSDLVSE